MNSTILEGLARRGFSDREFDQRLNKVQRSMQASGIDGLLLTTEPEIRYFSGFFTQFWQSPTRPWFLLVPANGLPVAVIPAIGEACMSRTWIRDIRCWSSPHPTDDGITLLVDTLHELLGQRALVGLLKGRETVMRMPLNDYESLLEKLPHYRFCDATDLVLGQRQIKSAEEIAKIESACKVAAKSFEQLPDFVTTGDTEISIFKQFKTRCLINGVDDVNYLVGASAPDGYDDIIAPPTERITKAGDILILDTGCVYDGYFCDFDRNFGFDSADDKTRVAYRQVHQALEAGLASAKPGVRCCELFDVMQREMNTVDSGNVGRLGHGLGMQLTESPSITSFDQTVLVPGMVMTLEPGLSYGRGKMMVHEENIVIEQTGARLLTPRASAEIPLLGNIS